MRRGWSIAKATALEILSEPLSLLVLLAALALTVFAPAFHYHQFGEPMRMARDAGFSSIFTCGSVLAVFGTLRAFRREIESGTLEMALSHSVSRTGFFLSKTLGAILATSVFVAVVFGTMMLIVEGSVIGAVIARQTGDIARIFGPCLAGGVSVILLPLGVAAILNRFARFRFVLTAFSVALALALSAMGVTAWLDLALLPRFLPVLTLLLGPIAVFLVTAAALGLRFKANIAASGVGLLVLVAIPTIGNYYLVDALSNGGRIAWGYVGFAWMVILPELLAVLALGVRFINVHE